MQDILLARTKDELRTPDGWTDIEAYYSDRFELCPHQKLLGFANHILKALPDKETASVTYYCAQCNKDAQVEIGNFGFESKIALVMTRWISLGPGHMEEDPLWATRTGLRPRTFYNNVSVDDSVYLIDPEYLLPVHSPRLCFERNAPHSFENLRSRNLFYLKDEQYKNDTRTPFIAAADRDLWYIPCTRPLKQWKTRFPWSLLNLY
jgi:hypothetical protein